MSAALPPLDVAIWTSGPYLGDGLFSHDPALDRDGSLAHFHQLRAALEAAGGSCHSFDVQRDAGRRPDLVLYLDTPAEHPDAIVPAWAGVPRWVVLQECEAILARNWDRARHAEFDRVLTWDDALATEPGYVLQRFPSLYNRTIPEPLDLDAVERNLCSLIAGNKRSPHPRELYSRRVEAIRWFEANDIDAFDLYGGGWNGFPSWMGRVDRKRDVLERYWFSICFENAHGIPGYVTEKLFDCLLARTVPVYLGPDEIEDLVPAACFVDARRFPTFEALHAHLTAIEPDAYVAHLEAARAFLASDAVVPFTAEGWVATLVRELAAVPAARLAA